MGSHHVLILVILLVLVLLLVFVGNNNQTVEGINNMDNDNIGGEISVLSGQVAELTDHLKKLTESITYYGDPNHPSYKDIIMQLADNYNYLAGFKQNIDYSSDKYYTNIQLVHQGKVKTLKNFQESVAATMQQKETDLSNNQAAYLEQIQILTQEKNSCIKNIIDKMTSINDYVDYSVCNLSYNPKKSQYDKIYTKNNVKSIEKAFKNKLNSYTEIYDISMAYYNSMVSATAYVEELLPLANEMRMHLQFFLGGKIDEDSEEMDGFLETYVVPYLESSGLDSLSLTKPNKSFLDNKNMSEPPVPQVIMNDLMTLKKSTMPESRITHKTYDPTNKEDEMQLLTQFFSKMLLF